MASVSDLAAPQPGLGERAALLVTRERERVARRSGEALLEHDYCRTELISFNYVN